MIICHEQRILFVKTKKTAGTSFEIALSKFCGESCIVTPITPADEAVRKQLGFRTAQNFNNYSWKLDGLQTNAKFYNHMPAPEVKRLIPPRVWNEYKKVTIVRNPYDYAISRYFWEGGERLGLSFLDYLRRFPAHLRENSTIAPLEGDARLDFYLRYEDLKNELVRASLDFMWQDFSRIRAKGDKRPKQGASLQEIYGRFPEAAGIVEENCGLEIAALGYAPP